MFNRIVQQIQHACSRVPSPACLIDRLLDRIETLGRSVLYAKADNRFYGDADDQSAQHAVSVVARSTGIQG